MSSLFNVLDDSFVSTVLFMSFKGSVIIALVLLIQRLGCKWFSAQTRSWLWIPALFCLFIPFSIATSWSPFTSLTESPAPVFEEGLVTVSAIEPAPAPEPNTWLFAWALCAAFLLSVVLYNLFRSWRIQSHAQSLNQVVDLEMDDCKVALALHRNVQIVESGDVETPSVHGWLKPTIVLPEGMTKELNADEMKFVLLHELAHVKRHDIAMNWVVTMVQILHWFNPVVWYGFRRMREDHEIACDARVLSHLPQSEHTAYGHTLISLMDRYPRAYQFSQGLGIVGNTKRMKERLHMIKQYKTFRKRHIVVGAASLIVVALLAFSENRARAHDVHVEEGDRDSVEHDVRELRERIKQMDVEKVHEHVREIHDRGIPELKDRLHESLDILRRHGTAEEKEHVRVHIEQLDRREREEHVDREEAEQLRVRAVQALKNVEQIRERKDVHRNYNESVKRLNSALREDMEYVRRHDRELLEREHAEKRHNVELSDRQTDMRSQLEMEIRELETEQVRIRQLQARLREEAAALDRKAADIAELKERIAGQEGNRTHQ